MIDFEQIIIPTIASRFKRLRYNEVRTLAPEIISYGQKSAILKLEKAGVPKSGNFISDRLLGDYSNYFDETKEYLIFGKQKELERGTNEYLFGIEWDVVKRLTISGGAQITDYGLSDNFQSDVSFSCDSYSLGFGAKVMLSEKMALNVGYMWTNYHDYTKKSENYCGTNLPGTNVYSRTNKVFGLSLDYAF